MAPVWWSSGLRDGARTLKSLPAHRTCCPGGLSVRSLSVTQTWHSPESSQPSQGGFLNKFLGPQAALTDTPHKINRWAMFLPAFATHICLGAPYGWSAISAALSKEHGWVIAAGGLSAAIMGPWTMKVGTRMALTTGGTLFGLGFALSAAGVANHNLAVLYAGNLLCGFGYGCSYTPPIQALLEWFPDKKGLASGIVIAGFGSGALFFSPMMNFLTRTYSQIPEYLGSSLETITEGGKIFTRVGDSLKEVVYATQADLAKLPYSDMMEGF
eukprot:TCALIF_00566-PA protein Name:"Similar to yhjX Uncharacterized MFS-type transporter YhjX (Escherichia coli (strain K12))" AED:0.10 eAED:0.28 QI:0/0.75/0.8/1/0.75/0.4/5/779/269